MRTKNVIEGLKILQKYWDDETGSGYNTGAEHDTIYADATDKPVEPTDLERLIELGWFQEDAPAYDGTEDFQAKHYDPEESWACYV